MSAYPRVERRRWSGSVAWGYEFDWVDAAGVKRRFRRILKWAVHKYEAAAEAKDSFELYKRTGTPYTQKPTKATAAMTFGQFVEGPYSELYLSSFKNSTQITHRKLLARWLRPALETTPLAEVKSEAARRVLLSIPDDKRPTRRKVWNLLRAVMGTAVSGEHVQEVRWDHKRLRPLWRVQKEKKEVMDAEKLGMVLGAANAEEFGFLLLAVYLGLRGGEIRALQVGDVNFEKRVVTVRRAMSIDVEYERTKSNKEREVPIPEALMSHLREACRSKLPKARVVSVRGGMPSQSGMYQRLIKLQKRLGFKTFYSFHSLRHSYLTMLGRSGTNIEAIRKAAGHSSLAITQGYMHDNDEDRDRIRQLTIEVKR